MNDDDLTTAFHKAFDDAVPDPHLYTRVESAVTRKTLTRRIALGLTAVAVPAAAFAAITFLPSSTPDGPDVVVDPAPTAAPSDDAPPSRDETDDQATYVAPIDLSPTVFAWVTDDNQVELGDQDGNRTTGYVIGHTGDGQEVVALAGRMDDEFQHVAAIVRHLDQDGAPQFRVDRLSWPREVAAPAGEDFRHVEGPMFSQFDLATYSATFTPDGRLVVFMSAPGTNSPLGVTTIDFDDLTVLEGRDIEVPTTAVVRVDDVSFGNEARARSEDGQAIVVDLENGTSYATAYGTASSWIFDDQASRLLFSSDEAIWVVREFPERSGMREVFLPFDAMALAPTDLRLVEGPFGVTHLQYLGDVWRLEDTDWVEVGTLPATITGFVAGADLARPVEPVDRSGWTADAVTTSTPIDERGAGAVEVGMTLAEVRRVTGQDVVVTYDFDGFCMNTRIVGVEGFSMTFLPAGDEPVAPEDAVLATVEAFEDRGSAGNRTREGVGPGMTEDDLLAAYPGAVQSPNKYDPESSYWDVEFEDGLGIRFNTTPDGIIRSVFGGNDHRLALEGCA